METDRERDRDRQGERERERERQRQRAESREKRERQTDRGRETDIRLPSPCDTSLMYALSLSKVLKSVVAQFNAAQLISQRAQVSKMIRFLSARGERQKQRETDRQIA